MNVRLSVALIVSFLSLSATAEYAVISGTNLLKWNIYSASINPPQIPYNRMKHFGVWVTDLLGSSCQNTRNQVLIRDSAKECEFIDKRQCYVEKGVWDDPYTDQLVTDPDELQVDHVVPLKNAYDMGAWTWGENRRCLFANYMGNNFHLRAVSGIENMIKQAASPDSYIPPNEKHVCEYLRNWLAIKLIWNLKMTIREATAIRNYVQEYACDTAAFKLTAAYLNEQRSLIQKQQPRCQITN